MGRPGLKTSKSSPKGGHLQAPGRLAARDRAAPRKYRATLIILLLRGKPDYPVLPYPACPTLPCPACLHRQNRQNRQNRQSRQNRRP